MTDMTFKIATLPTLLAMVAGCGLSRADDLDGQLTFERVEVDVGSPTAGVETADVDGDGRLDLIVAAGSHIAVLANIGGGRFEVSSRVDAGPYAVDLASADLDGDGRLDLAIANHETTHVTVLFGVPGGFAARGDPRMRAGVEPHPHAVGLGDIDGDGNVDLLVDDRDRESLRVFPGLGDGTFSEPTLIDVGGDPYRGFVLTDLDGDGGLDLATPNPDRVAVLMGDRDGGFAEPVTLDAGFAPFSVTTGDFDGDGLTDLAAGSGEGAGSLAVWRGRADGSFGPATRYEIAAGPTKSSAADLDGDGRDELLVASYLGGEVAVLAAGGVQRFSVEGYPYGFAAGDLDGDGLVDFAVANDATEHITLFLTR